MHTKLTLAVPVVLVTALLPSCSGSQPNPQEGGTGHEASPPPQEASTCLPSKGKADAKSNVYCDLPGSLVFGAHGSRCLVPGGKADAPSLDWLTMPEGYCVHYYARVPTVRQLRFAPGGELFVASPSVATSGGAPPGLGAIVVLNDDDADGYADGDALPHPDGSGQDLQIFTRTAAIQGLLFDKGFFYYQDSDPDPKYASYPGILIMRVPYKTGERKLSGTPVRVLDMNPETTGRFYSEVHWPRTLDVADDGTIYVGNGGDQGETCDPNVFPRPVHGGVFKLGSALDGAPVTQGLRNPIAIRCQRGHNNCFSAELGLDDSGNSGGREKIVPIQQGEDWGYPCCATTNLPYSGVGSPNCSMVMSEKVSFVIGDTPFGLDFEPGKWPAQYQNDMFVALHGQVGSWIGARVVAIPTDSHGLPVGSSDLDGGAVPDIVTGWDNGSRMFGRPSAIAFGVDGRAYIGNDFNGDIFWIAPTSLAAP